MTRLARFKELSAKLNRNSIPPVFEPPKDPVQSTPARKIPITDSRFNTPAVAHHYGQNTVIQVDGEVASFNHTECMDASAKRLALLEAQVDDDVIKKNVKEKLDLSTIYEDAENNEESNLDEKDSETCVFESTCGSKPVTSMVQILEKNSIAITTTVGNAEPDQRPAVVDVVDIDDDGKIQVYRKFMAAENWKNLTFEEEQELVNWNLESNCLVINFQKISFNVCYQKSELSAGFCL